MTRSYFNSASAALAVAYPPQEGLRGACTTLADLCLPSYRQPRLHTRQGAARDCIRRNYEQAVSYGHGNRAAKRAAQIETAAWFEAQGGLTEADVDVLADRYAEKQGARRLFPHATSFHD